MQPAHREQAPFWFQDEDSDLINNRQGGRRRGRGGGQRQGGGGQGQRDNGNRIDSRARGNASQLYEKYKNMARDAQLSGDRVTTEYYLQFADHYFRVLSDQRGRADDQGQRRQRDDFDQFDDGDDFGDEGEQIRGDEQLRFTETQPRREQPREQREAREPRDQRDGREPREVREPAREDRRPAPVPVANDLDEAAPAETAAEPRRRGRPRKRREDQPAEDAGERVVAFEADRLPPSIAPVSSPDDDADEVAEAPKPRRRRARAAGEVTPAE